MICHRKTPLKKGLLAPYCMLKGNGLRHKFAAFCAASSDDRRQNFNLSSFCQENSITIRQPGAPLPPDAALELTLMPPAPPEP